MFFVDPSGARRRSAASNAAPAPGGAGDPRAHAESPGAAILAAAEAALAKAMAHRKTLLKARRRGRRPLARSEDGAALERLSRPDAPLTADDIRLIAGDVGLPLYCRRGRCRRANACLAHGALAHDLPCYGQLMADAQAAGEARRAAAADEFDDAELDIYRAQLARLLENLASERSAEQAARQVAMARGRGVDAQAWDECAEDAPNDTEPAPSGPSVRRL